jgi:hypothetical protein
LLSKSEYPVVGFWLKKALPYDGFVCSSCFSYFKHFRSICFCGSKTFYTAFYINVLKKKFAEHRSPGGVFYSCKEGSLFPSYRVVDWAKFEDAILQIKASAQMFSNVSAKEASIFPSEFPKRSSK